MYKIIDTVPALEARFTNPIVTLTRRTPMFYDCYKVFLYSKVLQSHLLHDLDEQLLLEPYIHTIVLPNSNTIIQYIWDTRNIVNAFQSAKVAKVIRDAPWHKCARDTYSAYHGVPLLNNPDKFELAFDAMKLAKDWTEPKFGILLSHHDQEKDTYEFDISVDKPNLGNDIYIGRYDYYAKTKKAEVDIDKDLLNDIYPQARNLQSNFKLKSTNPLSYDTILEMFLNGLTQ